MLNSNPVCNPPNDLACDPTKMAQLQHAYPTICLDISNFDPRETEVPLIGDDDKGWYGLTTDYDYGIVCRDDTWFLDWVSITVPPANPEFGSEQATDGSFPDLTFPTFSSTGGNC